MNLALILKKNSEMATISLATPPPPFSETFDKETFLTFGNIIGKISGCDI
jgi:hypothetical protein